MSEIESKLTSFLLREAQKEGQFSSNVFHELLRTIPCTAFEVVPLYVDEAADINVFLTKRDASDKYWPEYWHSPGTIVLNEDISNSEDFGKAWERLKKIELGNRDLPEPVIVTTKLLVTKRGIQVSLIHFVLVPNDLSGGSYFPVDKLPQKLVEHHNKIIREAAFGLAAESQLGRVGLKVNIPK